MTIADGCCSRQGYEFQAPELMEDHLPGGCYYFEENTN